jgi:hypothetical protein
MVAVSLEDLFCKTRVLWFVEEKNREKMLSIRTYSMTREVIQNKFSKIRRKKASDET